MSYYDDEVRRFKRQLLRNTLIGNAGHVQKAARELQISRNTMSRQMKACGVDPVQVRADYRRYVKTVGA